MVESVSKWCHYSENFQNFLNFSVLSYLIDASISTMLNTVWLTQHLKNWKDYQTEISRYSTCKSSDLAQSYKITHKHNNSHLWGRINKHMKLLTLTGDPSCFILLLRPRLRRQVFFYKKWKYLKKSRVRCLLKIIGRDSLILWMQLDEIFSILNHYWLKFQK